MQAFRSSTLVPRGLTVESTALEDGEAIIVVRAVGSASVCPGCGASSDRVHSRYRRRLADLPIAGHPVRLVVIARRFYCAAVLCGRRIFAERFDSGLLAPWARRTSGAGYLKGYMDSEIVGRHFSAFYTDADKVAGKPAQGLEIAAARGRFSDEVWRVRKDGSQFWAGVVITAIRDEHDKLLGFGIVTHDLTDRQHQQRRLTDANLELERRVLERTASLSDLTKRLESEIQERREATELLEKTFDATPLPMMISDAKSNVLMWNKAGEKTFGFTQAEMIEGGFGLLVADGGQAETNRVREAARRGQVTLMPRIRHRDGHMLDLHIIVTPLFRADGAIRATVTMLEDLTQRNLIDAQLRQSQKMEAIGTLTGGMAHDFNNLLGIIIGNLDMLRDARANDPDIDELAGEALDAAMRGAELTRSLLAFARRQPLQPRHLDLDVVIAGVVNLLSRTLGEDIEMALNFSQNLCSVVADPAQLEASLINLATNARDAMPRGGKLTVATMHQTLRANDVAANPDVPPGDYAVIEVTDTGEGMTPEVRSRIFEPFFTTKDERGTGLGLSMVFGFMKQSGGHLSVYSEPGVGTTFRLYFPCSLADLEVEYDLGPDDLLRGHGETILAVEDSDPLRRIVVRQLTGLGYRVIEASTGSAALAILATEHVDLLFTDVVMPGGVDGVALVAIATERHPNLKVILTSGFPRTRFVDQIAQNEPPLLSKPYRKDDLARLVRAVINGNDAASDV